MMRRLMKFPVIVLVSAVDTFSQIPEDIDKKYSYGSFTGKSFRNVPASEFNNKTIYKSVFSQQEPDTVVFPVGVTGLVLVCVNVDNVVIPAGVTLDNRGGECGSSRRYHRQNDGRDWIVDGSNRPTRLVNEEFEVLQGRSIDKADIPTDGEVVTLRTVCLTRATTQYQTQRCQQLTFHPDDMRVERVAERRTREGVRQ